MVLRYFGGNGVEVVVFYVSEDISFFVERLDGVVFEVGNDIGYVVELDMLENFVFEEGIVGEEFRVVFGFEDDEENKLYEVVGGFMCGGSVIVWDFVFFMDGGFFCGIDFWGDVKYGVVNLVFVISVVKSWIGLERWEEEYLGGVVKNGWYIFEYMVFLVV